MTAVFGFGIPALGAISGGMIGHAAFGAPLGRATLDWWLDIVARLGGDEFAIILENCAASRTAAIGKQLSRALAAWLQAADDACYEAKREGRGQIRVA